MAGVQAYGFAHRLVLLLIVFQPHRQIIMYPAAAVDFLTSEIALRRPAPVQHDRGLGPQLVEGIPQRLGRGGAVRAVQQQLVPRQRHGRAGPGAAHLGPVVHGVVDADHGGEHLHAADVVFCPGWQGRHLDVGIVPRKAPAAPCLFGQDRAVRLEVPHRAPRGHVIKPGVADVIRVPLDLRHGAPVARDDGDALYVR